MAKTETAKLDGVGLSELTVWKYPLKLARRQVLTMPVDARFLHIATHCGTACAWAVVNPAPDAPVEQRHILMYGTGYLIGRPEVCGDLHYLGTTILHALVWHFFEETEAGGGS